MTSNIEKQNYTYCMETISIRNGIEGSFLDLAAHLYKIREERLFQPSWETFEEYSMELKMSYSSVNKLIAIYETFILKYNFAPKQIISAGWTVVADFIPRVKTKKEAEHWLHIAATNTRQHLRQTLSEHKKGIEIGKCTHSDTYLLRICRVCGDRERVYEK